MRSRRSVVAGVFVLLGIACAQPAPAPAAPDLAAEEKAVREVSMKWLAADKAKDPAGASSVMADDAIIFRAHEQAIHGAAGYKDFATKDYAANPKGVIDWNTTSVTVAASGDMAVETGDFRFSGGGPKGDIADSGSFVTVYRKMGGEWKVIRDISASRTPEKK